MKPSTTSAGPALPVPAAPVTTGAAGPAPRAVPWLAERRLADMMASDSGVRSATRAADGADGRASMICMRAAPDGTRVLIVDDNVDAADTLADLLRLDGYAADVCYGEQQALEQARVSAPDIVILDLAMPERGGHALARELRALLPQALLIAFTGFSGSQDVERSLQSGIDEHWVKPMSAASFALALATARARHSSRSPR